MMKNKILVFIVLLANGPLMAEEPKDVFLEANPNSESALQDLPPNEPPYVQTQDEKEAKKILETLPVSEKNNSQTLKKSSEANEIKTEVKETKKESKKSVLYEKPDYSSGRPKVAHPFQDKGLYLIDQNTGTYYYRTQRSTKKSQSMSIRLGMFETPSITAQEGSNQFTFADMYGDNYLPGLLLDYEWKPFSKFRGFSLVMGLGFFTATGSGKYLDPNVRYKSDGTERLAKEEFTFIGLPISAGLLYRLQVFDRQWIAPFISGGLSYYVLAELRDDGRKPHGVGTPAAYGGGGLMFNITSWSKEIAFTMDTEYGIANMWFVGEYRYIAGLNQDLDVTSSFLNFGIAVDY